MRLARTLTVLIVLTSTLVTAAPAGAQSCSTALTINPPDNTALPNAEKGAAYQTTITVSGGSGHYNFQHAGGTLPPGLDWSPKGHGTGTLTISGTPTSYGFSNFTFAIYDWPNYPGALNCIAVQARYSIDVPYADLTVSQSASPNPPLAGQDLTIDATVANNGDDIAFDTVFTETLPSNMTLKSGRWWSEGFAHEGECSGNGATVTCNVGHLSNGELDEFDVRYIRIIGIPTSTEPMTFTASARSSTYDPNTANNTSTLQLQPDTSLADLDIAVIPNKERYASREVVSIKVGIDNHGPARAESVEAHLTLEGMRVIEIDPQRGTCTRANAYPNASPVCTIGAIDSGGVVEINIKARPHFGGRPEISGLVTSATSDPSSTNNRDAIKVRIDLAANLKVNSRARGGGEFLYTVRNEGPDYGYSTKLIIIVRGPARLRIKDHYRPFGRCEIVQGEAVCREGAFPRETEIEILIDVIRTGSDPVILKAQVRSDTPDPNLDNNIDRRTYS